ncbi:MAG: hypothetical protein AMJ92_03350 [candidate division Zixibacteria bacterium SM23_81]|nr:MAG: hypothetical protein AMJ92_03350 [candidate division Zixibacteria bacterium SM23_81]
MNRFLNGYLAGGTFSLFPFSAMLCLRDHIRVWDRIVLLSALLTSVLFLLLAVSPVEAAVDDDYQIGFRWQPPANAETTVAYYHIYLSVDEEAYQLVDTTTDTSYVVEADGGHYYRLRVAGVNAYQEEGPLSLESEEVLCQPALGERPIEYQLHQNYPNPFNANTTLSYQTPEANRVVLAIFNVQGQKVRTLVDDSADPGLHQVSWDGTDDIGMAVASGVYFCQMWCGDFLDVKKITVIR